MKLVIMQFSKTSFTPIFPGSYILLKILFTKNLSLSSYFLSVPV